MKRFAAVPLLTLLVLCGCGKPESKFVGKYEGKVTMSNETLDEIMKIGKQLGRSDEEIEKGISEARVGLELMNEGKATVWSSSDGKEERNAATWVLSEDEKTITVTFDPSVGLAGTPANEMLLVVSDGGRALSFTRDMPPFKVDVVYTRK
ncbi:MAG: hypothetical protein WD716_03380 [Fimbriimonadaceae bacterium]